MNYWFTEEDPNGGDRLILIWVGPRYEVGKESDGSE